MSLGDLFAFVMLVASRLRVEFLYVGGYILFELLVRSRLARPLIARGYWLDLFYCAIYRFGIFAILLDTPIREFIYGHLTVQALFDVPVWGRVILYVLILDFANYWVHRIEHRVPALWAFHQVHHSQEHLTIMSTYRNHPLDVWLRGIVGPVITMVLVGLPPAIWLWLSILWDVTLSLSHLEVNWTYGPLRWVFVSPVSHAIHHSVEPRHQDRNFGANLVIWDRLFGTADLGRERPAKVGLPGWSVRDNVLAHAWAPIRGVVRWYRGLPLDGLAPLAPSRGSGREPPREPSRDDEPASVT